METPLHAWLSWALVAFTIEFDNEAEHRLPHRTTVGRKAGERTGGPWLVSMAMWSNLMRVLPPEGATIAELKRRACVAELPLAGMRRWGYITVEGDRSGSGKPPHRPGWVIHPTRQGALAQEVWRPLAAEVERRWEMRFGLEPVDALRVALEGVVSRLGAALPAYLPVAGYGLFCVVLPEAERAALGAGEVVDRSLAAMLAKVLLAFAVAFERDVRPDAGVSLAVAANALRLLDDVGVRARDLPGLAGVSREGMAMALGYLVRHGFAVEEASPASPRTKLARLTAKGLSARESYVRRVREIESEWAARFGAETISSLRTALEPIVIDRARLFAGLTGYAQGWRTIAGGVKRLPDFPMVLHRGGWPDGS